MSKELIKEYLEDLDHYDEGMGIHSTSYGKCRERLIRLAEIDNADPGEALERLEFICKILKEKSTDIKWLFKNDYNIIKQALIKAQDGLKRLETIDNANPSEALECLEILFDTLCEREHTNSEHNFWLKQFNTIEQYILKAQKQEKENAEYKQLEKQLGCPLNLVLNLIKNSNKLDKHCHTQDIWFEYEGQVIYGSFLRLGFEDNKFVFYIEASLPNSIYDFETTILYVKDHKKTWWLKEDKSE